LSQIDNDHYIKHIFCTKQAFLEKKEKAAKRGFFWANLESE